MPFLFRKQDVVLIQSYGSLKRKMKFSVILVHRDTALIHQILMYGIAAMVSELKHVPSSVAEGTGALIGVLSHLLIHVQER